MTTSTRIPLDRFVPGTAVSAAALNRLADRAAMIPPTVAAIARGPSIRWGRIIAINGAPSDPGPGLAESFVYTVRVYMGDAGSAWPAYTDLEDMTPQWRLFAGALVNPAPIGSLALLAVVQDGSEGPPRPTLVHAHEAPLIGCQEGAP